MVAQRLLRLVTGVILIAAALSACTGAHDPSGTWVVDSKSLPEGLAKKYDAGPLLGELKINKDGSADYFGTGCRLASADSKGFRIEVPGHLYTMFSDIHLATRDGDNDILSFEYINSRRIVSKNTQGKNILFFDLK